MSDFSEMCDIIKGYCTDKRFREKVFKYKKYPQSKKQGIDYCIYLYKRFIKYVENYHRDTYENLDTQKKSALRDEVFFPLALEAFNKAFDMLEDRFKRWYEQHPEQIKRKHNGRKQAKHPHTK